LVQLDDGEEEMGCSSLLSGAAIGAIDRVEQIDEMEASCRSFVVVFIIQHPCLVCAFNTVSLDIQGIQ
jgi:hypothetical protein